MHSGLKTAVLMAGLTALFVVVGGVIGGTTGMVIALVFALAMNAGAYWFSDKMVLRMYKAQPVDRDSAPRLWGTVEELAGRAGLPMPAVYIIEEGSPNAFATGRNPEHAAVAVTTGLMDLLDEREVRGVLAHELAHVKNRDILISTIAATVAGAISALASMAQFMLLFGGRPGEDDEGNPLGIVGVILVMILAPIAASLIQMAISRAREYGADRGGAEISGDPEALARALEKLAYGASRQPMASAESHPETAQMMIVNPLSGQDLMQLFSTHPPLDDRIERLRALG
ncbi:protease HtpX [Thiohalorhabdus denitrificans]|uniref:Protease HtpX n=1 Tax=Thiohalorhabdus denitrificans TaxID=381306 RepID=A0A0P9CQB0_9GAMM|nr:zinc metalloprotease HtpX [Thiohalorhabdus denitrificans]KPV41359.1 protease HtpX [Thiohalorhabdus denitrificans]SCY24324.1 heat shock protein HtpX [Thiohalorhabdus denitrificans]